MDRHMGEQTIKFADPPSITAAASVVGPKEGEGPLARYFDVVSSDDLFGTDSWEKAESEIVRQTVELAVEKANLEMKDIQYMLAGDLLNQLTGSTFGLRGSKRPYFGLFGACSTIGMALTLGAVLVDGGYADHVIASASSHFCCAEKTFRFPLELGTQRTPTASWTVTGDGAAVISRSGDGPRITAATTGRIVDMGIKDANHMGAAMAPAAADVVTQHFRDLRIEPGYYDIIATGDLGVYGRKLFLRLMKDSGYNLDRLHTDCGIEIFYTEGQDVHAGGSGCGCSASVFAGYFYTKLKEKEINRLLFIPTGALHSVVIMQQGESIPAIAHAVAIENI
ncbi:MAG: stage V sporulation protein AD [Clostridiales bacterium]|jgi:stage V sporulation protein AD|nr:stage V sporulation protein AD [Clostridiales bacterium]